jgi:hypothetical protein
VLGRSHRQARLALVKAAAKRVPGSSPGSAPFFLYGRLMTPEALIIQRPGVDLTTFLGVALKVLGRSLSSAADMSSMKLSDAERFLSCLAAMRNGITTDTPRLLSHLSYSILVVADEADVMDILECAAGMAFLMAETQVRNVLAAVLTGTLAQWKAAVLAGASQEMEATVRFAYNKIYSLFRAEGVNIWTNYRQKPARDQRTFLLEDKRGR